MQQVIISSIEIRDFNSIKGIADECFGKNYLTINQLNKILNQSGIFSKIQLNGKLIGFCISTIMEKDENNFNFKVYDFQEEKIAVIKTIGIHPDFQRRGYGTQLLKHVIQKIKTQKGISSIYYPSWIESKSDGFCSSVKKEGFKEFQMYKNFWANDSIQNNYTCIRCGNPPCNCSMRLYRKV